MKEIREHINYLLTTNNPTIYKTIVSCYDFFSGPISSRVKMEMTRIRQAEAKEHFFDNTFSEIVTEALKKEKVWIEAMVRFHNGNKTIQREGKYRSDRLKMVLQKMK